MKFLNRNELGRHRASLAGAPAAGRSVWVCGGPGCLACGSKGLFDALQSELAAKTRDTSLKDRVKAFFSAGDICPQTSAGMTGCMGPCELGPVVYVEPEGWYYHKVLPEHAAGLLEAVSAGKVYAPCAPFGSDGKRLDEPREDNIPFFEKQNKLVLGMVKNCPPLDLDAYLKQGGFMALEKALFQMEPSAVCDEIAASGLRGRGGGGFLTGRKWRAAREVIADKKYVLVNGDEGDPGAFMDRCLMEGAPFAVLEGLIIGGYAVGAGEGIIYVRHEYPLAVKTLREAIKLLEASGLLGGDILGSGFSFSAEICEGGGAFVCGESTALMSSIEGRPGVPRVKYIRSSERGLWESPTVLNNVETWACVPRIISMGAEEYKKIGTEKSPGTKVFALVGKVKTTGLAEVPMGMTLREIIFGIGGGIQGDRAFKAVQTGGPSGGCLPESMLDTPVDFDGLAAAGSMMGSGGMIVMDEYTCMVDVARYFIDFLSGESCGKCAPCREGLKKMQLLLRGLANGTARPGDTEMLGEIAEAIACTALCGLGQSAANPVLSTIKYFGEEYREHEEEGFCRAGVCSGMYLPEITAEKCRSCGACGRVCPSGAIRAAGDSYEVDRDACTTCGACAASCRFGAVAAVRRTGR